MPGVRGRFICVRQERKLYTETLLPNVEEG
jgi:hypothetical protein